MKQYMKKMSKGIKPLVGLLVFSVLTNEAQALPMFTAQTGMDCTGCHTQQMPRLNKFGRKFAASGMTISKQVSELNTEDSALTSTSDINPSILIKSKYFKTYDKPDGKGIIDTSEDSTNDGEFSPLRMATIFLGGRVTENFGAILKLGHRQEEGESIEGKAVYAHGINDHEGYLGAVFYSTSSLGPFSGMESYNTGLYRPLRMFDNKNYSNANQSTKIGARAATGLQVYYDQDNVLNGGDHFFVTAGIYAPSQDNAGIDMGDNLLPFARIAYEHPIGDFNVILGAFAIVGGDEVSNVDALSIKRETYGIDMQIEGHISDKEATLALTNVFKNKVDYTGMGSQLTHETEDVDNESFSVEAALSLTPSIIAKLGYMNYDDHYVYVGRGLGLDGHSELKNDAKDIEHAVNVGLDYGFNVQDLPMKLALEYAWMQPYLERVENYQAFMATLTLPF